MISPIDFIQDTEEESQHEKASNVPTTKQRPFERHLARSGARVFETLAGGLGDILSGAESFIKTGTEKLTGQKLPDFQLTEKIFNLPTTKQFQEVEQGLLGNYLQPQTKAEEFSDDVIKSAASLSALKMPINQASTAALMGTGLRYMGKALDAPEWVQMGLDMTGTVLGGTRFKNINEYKNLLYSQTRNALPGGAKTEAEDLLQYLNAKEKFLMTGLKKSPQKQNVIDAIKEVKDKIVNNEIDVQDLWDTKKDVFKKIGNYEEVKGYKNVLKELNKKITSTLYGYENRNPEFVKLLKQSDKFFGESANFEKATDFLNSIKEAEKFGAAFALLNGDAGKFIAMVGGASVFPAIFNLIKNPRVASFYSKSMVDAFKGSRAGMLNNMRKLDEEVKKSMPSSDIDFIED